MGEVWIREAERLEPAGNHNPMSGIGGPRATLHCTVSYPGSFAAMHRVLTTKEAEPHLLYDPKTDRLGQYFPLDRAARALARGTLAYSHNRVGSVNIQIEVCEMPRDWTAQSDWHPGPNFRAMIRAVRSWGIADEFIFRPAKSGTDRDNVVRPNNLLTSTAGGGRWWGHCHYGQGESHWDPGPLNLERFFGAAPTTAQEDDEMAAADVTEIKAYIRALLIDGYTANGVDYPGIAKVDIENQKRIAALTQSVATLAAAQSADKATLDAVLAAVKGGTVDLDAVRAAAREGSEAGVKELLTADVVADVDVKIAPKDGAA